MTIEEYFKDKINWKIFNCIVDACTLLEDSNIPYAIYVCSKKQASPSMEPHYGYIFTRFYINNNHIRMHYDNEEFKLDDYIKCYEKDGLYYMFAVGKRGEIVRDKLIGTRKLEFVEEQPYRDDVKVYLFKEK